MGAERPLVGGAAVAVGADLFADALARQGVRVARVAWTPSLRADRLATLWRDEIDTANRTALERLLEAHPFLVDVRPAIDLIPGMTRDTILHAGPPIAWERMSGPMRGAVGGALVYEGLARTIADAERAASRGDVRFSPCHHHGSVGPMAGIITASMPVFVVENRAHGNHAWSTINEGLGKALRYGANAPDVLDRLVWFRDVLGGALGEAIRRAGGVDVRALIAQALQMGDECHNRNRAASALLVKLLAPEVAALDLPPAERSRILAFAAGNEHFFLNLGMAACKTATDAAHGVAGSTLVTAMARNGTDFGIRVSGLGDRWFTAPALTPVASISRASARATPTLTSATARSRRRRASARSPWAGRRRLSSSSAAHPPTRFAPPAGCTRSPPARAARTACPPSTFAARPPASTCASSSRRPFFPRSTQASPIASRAWARSAPGSSPPRGNASRRRSWHWRRRQVASGDDVMPSRRTR